SGLKGELWVQSPSGQSEGKILKQKYGGRTREQKIARNTFVPDAVGRVQCPSVGSGSPPTGGRNGSSAQCCSHGASGSRIREDLQQPGTTNERIRCHERLS